MATITAGELAGLSRPTALEFSFLLSIPTMAAATGYDLVRFIRHSGEGGLVGFDAHGIAVLKVGFVISFFVAWAVVAWFMSWVRYRGFSVFYGLQDSAGNCRARLDVEVAIAKVSR
jgi:undecaprenyl-diphosphatase